MITLPEGIQIAAALADQGILLRRFTEGLTARARCPKCDGGREREDSLTVTIDRGGVGAVWTCHRASCGWTDNLLIGMPRVMPFRASPRPGARKPPPVDDAEQKKNDNLYRFFEKRGISKLTVDIFRCYLTTHWFSRKGEYQAGYYPGIAFPYFYGTEVVNRKYRSPHKQIAQEKDPLHTLYNIDAVIDPEYVVWCEGETDTMAIYESGWHQVVSLKDGAPPPPKQTDDGRASSDPDKSRRFEALETHAVLLEKIKKVYLAGDSDPPGQALMEELARRLGRHRCWLVKWPSGRKDACEVLEHDGPETLNQCIADAKPYPIDGVLEITGEQLGSYLAKPPPLMLDTGLRSLDQIVRFPGEGRLIVITGVPNSGKSPFMINLMMHLMMRRDRRFLVFSPEMQPFEEFCVLCAQVMFGKAARRSRSWHQGDPLLSREDQLAAGDWLNSRLRFLASDADEVSPTLEWILDRSVSAALRLGITDVLIDPWNEIEHQRNGMTETDYVGRALQKCKAFSYRHGCNVWIVVHPTKLRPASPGEQIQAPGPYDISGSAHFANKSDVGLTVHRPSEVTEVTLWKARFYRWGKRNSMAELVYDPLTGRYATPLSVKAELGNDAWDELPSDDQVPDAE